MKGTTVHITCKLVQDIWRASGGGPISSTQQINADQMKQWNNIL